MTSPRTYADYLRDILAMIDKVETFTAGLEVDAFVRDDKTYMAVVQAIEIIGEATKQIPPSVRKKYPDLPWKKMAGMRDRLIHAYFRTDPNIVWETATSVIPQLKPLVAQVLRAEESDTA